MYRLKLLQIEQSEKKLMNLLKIKKNKIIIKNNSF
jgi:hypothetical protein